MTLKEQVTSFELSEKLSKLGVKQDGFWSWYDATDYDDIPRLNRSDENCPTCCLPQQAWEAKYSAFTAAELGEKLPPTLSVSKLKDGIWIPSGDFSKLLLSMEKFIKLLEEFKNTKSETNARSKLLIYLIENNLL